MGLISRKWCRNYNNNNYYYCCCEVRLKGMVTLIVLKPFAIWPWIKTQASLVKCYKSTYPNSVLHTSCNLLQKLSNVNRICKQTLFKLNEYFYDTIEYSYDTITYSPLPLYQVKWLGMIFKNFKSKNGPSNLWTVAGIQPVCTLTPCG